MGNLRLGEPRSFSSLAHRQLKLAEFDSMAMMKRIETLRAETQRWAPGAA